MKRVSLALLSLVMISVAINAQKSKINLGVTAGAVFSNYTAKADGEKDSGNPLVGPTVGVFLNIPAGKNLSFQPAIHYVGKGTKDEETITGTTIKVKLNINCIEVPLNLLYNHPTTGGTFFIGAGPSVAINVSGKGKYDDGSNSITGDIDFGSSPDDDFKSLDLGLNALTGFRFKQGFLVAVNFNAGLNNLLPDDNDGTFKSHYFGIRLGWVFESLK